MGYFCGFILVWLYLSAMHRKYTPAGAIVSAAYALDYL